jgi:DNA-binding SARP family transcriptional activator/predicted ATPase
MATAKLKITLLGGVTFRQGETAVANFASRKAEALLVYLACNPRPHPRETLAALLWPENDQSRALANLSVALNSVKKQLEPYIVAERHSIAFNEKADYELDTAVFQQAVRAAQERKRAGGKLGRIGVAQLEMAVALYNGDFLAGFNVRNVTEFEAWALLEQERLRQLFLNALADLIPFYQQRGQLTAAIECAQRLLAADPLQETIHRQLMSLYLQDNQRPAALSQYEQCARILDDELGVEPDEETTALYEAIKGDKETRRGGDKETPPLPFSPSPPLPTSPPHNLPAVANAFIGREAELAAIQAWMGLPDGRLLTIVGPGGIGKTRLAQEAARACLGQFADGVWLVSLVPFQNLDEAATAVAQALGLTLSGKEPLLSQLREKLRPLEALLVLDNLEHLLTNDLRDFLSQLTQEAADLRLIVTSRERLRLQAERALNLEGLLFTSHASRLTDSPAAQLFIDRAKRAQADFDAEGQAAAVGRLCQLVGGLPLALEMAAAWTRVLSVADVAAEIEAGLGRLTTPLHDAPERHRSLRAVIESSWQALPAAEQKLFRRLAVFRGGFSRAAAEQVAQAAPPQLLSLVDRSFLRLDGDQRFRRHPLLLQFAQEQLVAQPKEQAETEAAHGRFFADFVARQGKLLPGAEALAALNALTAELENIRAAWQWVLAAQEAALLEEMVTAVGRFFADRSRYLEGAAFFTETVSQVERWAATAATHSLLPKLQIELGGFWHENGRFAEAETILRAAAERAGENDLPAVQLRALRLLSLVTADQGDRQAAQAYLDEARRLCQTDGDAEQEMLILWRQGVLDTDNGDYAQAQATHEAAMTLAQTVGNRLSIARLRNSQAIVANRQGNYQEAARQWRLARAEFQAWGHEWGLAAASHNLAMAHYSLEEYDAALETITAAITAHEKIGHQRGAAAGLAVKATICMKLGRRREARRCYYDSLRLSQWVGATWLAAVTLVDVAELEMSYGALDRAATLLAFVVRHPATVASSLANAQKLLDELRAELSPKLMAEAETAAQSHTLDSLIAWLVNETP